MSFNAYLSLSRSTICTLRVSLSGERFSVALVGFPSEGTVQEWLSLMKQTLSVFDPRAAMGIHYLPPSQPIVTLPCPQLPPLLVSGFLGGIVPAFIARRYEKAMLTHSSILAWRIPWTKEPGGLLTAHGVAKSCIHLAWTLIAISFSCQSYRIRQIISTIGQEISSAIQVGPLSSTHIPSYPHCAAITLSALLLQLCLILCDPMDYSPPGFSVHGDSPGKNTGVGCHFLLQGIIPTVTLPLSINQDYLPLD